MLENCKNTLKAKWWKILLAKMFGIKCVSVDADAKVTSYQYKDMIYVVKVERIDLWN